MIQLIYLLIYLQFKLNTQKLNIHNFIQNTSEEYSNFVLANHKKP